ncbi:MAG: hypothetical protein HYZ00_08010, partial [Candidatus Hydrogenedentes bacterium]|nr:hypothetical protein [Candidatus Hydrogenedentota bacterium]
FCWLCVVACAGAAEEIAIPLKPDPPFAIDGDLSDWRTVPGASVAATRTAEGYAVEAAIPWDALGLESPAEGTRLRVEVAISDTDSAPEQQESLLTSATATWEITRLRLQAAVLARADGAVAAREAEGAPVFDAVTLARGAAQSFTFSLPTPLPAREAVLRLQARMEFPQVGGYTPALHLTVNGTVLDAPRLLNKPQRAKARGGAIYSMAAGDRFSTYYTPDFDSPDTHSIYGLVDGYAACTFDLRVTDLLRPGDNTLEVTHRGDVENALIAANAQILFVETLPQAREKAGPPIAPLPRLTPKLVHETEFSLEELPDAGIIVSVGAARYKFQSRSSTPDGVWVHGSNAHFKHERRVEKTAEVVRVYDSFQNLTDAPLPLMHRHEVQLDAAPDQLWLAGLDQPSREGNVTSASNPTLCARFGHHGFGLLPLDDVFRIHGAVYAVPGLAGLADNQLVLAPGATYTAEWALIPLAENGADYWTFLNAARRLVGANFLIDGGFAFLRNGPLTDAWSDAELSDFLKFKDPKYVCASIDHPRYNGMYTHGTSFQRVAHDSYRASFARWRQLAPAVDCLVYFHCFIDVVEDGPQLFADARLLGPDGAQADYGEPYDRLYIPLENNSFGPAIARNVDIILDTIQAEGVYWDEHEYSRLLYH